MDILKYSVIDFLLDESFQQWVINPQEGHWNSLLEQQPTKNDMAEEARVIVSHLKMQFNYTEDLEEQQKLWIRISNTLDTAH